MADHVHTLVIDQKTYLRLLKKVAAIFEGEKLEPQDALLIMEAMQKDICKMSGIDFKSFKIRKMERGLAP